MRISTSTLDTMRTAITPLDTESRRGHYRRGDIPRAEAVKDIDRRYRWDLYHAAGGWRLTQHESDLRDAHIDTALRSIVPAL